MMIPVLSLAFRKIHILISFKSSFFHIPNKILFKSNYLSSTIRCIFNNFKLEINGSMFIWFRNHF
uniref:Predicted protein n=1 Tax=Hordeum vulgare subsp. vulgare TaxID=112509 RepID=F2E6S7_HORVV|nr:predicted protein [Hordeum vulgare subsp. vulgare]